MKYDAGMTQFHGDIVAAVRLMCGKDTVARSNSEGASPAPLRDYLKKQYGYNGKCSNGVMYQNIPSKGMEISLDREVDNNGDNFIMLSWSQVAKFIRDNPSEIFGEENKPGNAENSPSIEVLDLDIRTFNAMKRAGINTLADAERLADYSVNHPEGLPLLSDAHRETIEAFKAYRDSQARQKTDFPCDDCGYDEKNCCNYPETPDDYCVCGDKQIPKNEEKPSFSIDEEISAPAQTETAVVFDYSELDTDTAEQLGKISENVINIKKKYIFDMAEQVKKAHDLLANHYGGKFGAWCVSVGISRDTGDNMVRVAELFGNSTEIERQNLEKLTDGNVKLLYEAARPSAPAELVEAVKSGDITTHKEYIALKKQLEEAEQKVDKLRENNQKMRTENIAALVRADKAEKQLEQSESRNRQFDESFKNIEAASKANYEKYLEELHKNQDLQVQIRKLEERPVEVAVEQDTAAIAERDERIAELEEQLRNRDSELDFGNNNASCDKMSEFYEMLHGKALNALKDCMAFIRSDDLPQIVKNRAVGRFGTLKDLIEMYIDELEEI